MKIVPDLDVKNWVRHAYAFAAAVMLYKIFRHAIKNQKNIEHIKQILEKYFLMQIGLGYFKYF